MIIHDCPLVSRLLEQLIAQCFSRGPAECEDDDGDGDDDDDDDDDDHDDETTMMIMIIIITIVIMIINPTQSPKSQKRGMDQNIDNLSFPTFSQKIIGSHTHTIMLSSGRLFPRDPLLPGLAGLSHGSCDSSQIQGGVAAKAL